jgi:hypothetical protein
MFKKLGLLAVSLLTISALPRGAAAQSCVTVDTGRDTLAEGERKAALMILTQNLQQNGVQVVQSACQGTFTVAHVKFGNSITVFLSGPPGTRQATATRMEDVPNLYSQMVRSLVTGKPMATTSDSIDRTNVTTAQAAPERAEADSLWYLRLGYGGVLGGTYAGGPSFGFGYRYELDSIGIDASFLNFTVADTGKNDDAAVNGSLIKLMGLYFLNPLANRSGYLGAGLSWAGTEVNKDDIDYSGSGLQGELSVGYELLRASTIRMFMQLDAQLPIYRAKPVAYSDGNSNSSSGTRVSVSGHDPLWAPSFVFSLGVGWGRGHSVVRVVQ